jgi:hypothetical protein
LIEHPAVHKAAVIGSPDDIRELIVKAFVILKPGIKPSEGLIREFQNHVKNVTAPYKYPRATEFVESLPKTVSGKIKRNVLHEREMKRSLNGNNAGKGCVTSCLTPYLYVISYIMYTSARVAKPGQRRQVQGLISQEFLGSNPIPRILFCFFLNIVSSAIPLFPDTSTTSRNP